MTTLKCPSCGGENLLGTDRCEHCLHSLMQVDLPKPHQDDRLQRTLMTRPVADLLTGKDLLIASPTDTLKHIVEIFQREKKSCILIYDRHQLVGIISYRDLLRRVAGRYRDLRKVTAEMVMTPRPECVRPEDPIAYAVSKMAMGGFRHLPVLTQDGRPFSIISIKDVLSHLVRRAAETSDPT
ncbi:MAG TPA: CBS domain-containing protein [bacterium]